MSEAMSSPTDWQQFYDQNLSNQEISSRVQFYDQNLSSQEISNRVRVLSPESLVGDQGSDNTTAVVGGTTTTSSGAPSPLGLGQGGSSGGGGQLSPEGRVGKPVRRRTRASRRTPTTLLNTDTTNFRALVQQFTGGPSVPFAAGAAQHGGPNFGFGFGGRQTPVNPNSLILPPTGLQFQYQQQHPQLIQHQNTPYMFSLNSNNNNNNNNNNNPGPGDLFFQRLGRNPRPNMEAAASAGSEGFVVEGVSSQVPPSRTTRSSNENRLMF